MQRSTDASNPACTVALSPKAIASNAALQSPQASPRGQIPIASAAAPTPTPLPPREARARARVPVTLRPDKSSPHRRRLCCGGILAGRGGKALPPAEVETAQMRDLVLDRCFGRGATSATFLLHRVRPPVWPGPQLQAKLDILDAIDPTLLSWF